MGKKEWSVQALIAKLRRMTGVTHFVTAPLVRLAFQVLKVPDAAIILAEVYHQTPGRRLEASVEHILRHFARFNPDSGSACLFQVSSETRA